MLLTQHTIDTPYLVGPVHCYTAVINDELVLFDTGPPTDTGRNYLREHLDLGRLRHVCITHCHLDHYGLSRWLAAESDARIYLPRLDVLKTRHSEMRISSMYALLTGYGFPGEYLQQLQESLNRHVLSPPFPDHYGIAEEEVPAVLGIEVLPCPGHSQSDLIYVGGDWAVTGDTLLRGIFQSPLLDIDLESGERYNNYEAYCCSLRRMERLRGKTIFPGHRISVKSLDDAILFYITKLLDRAAHIAPLRRRHSIPAIIDRLFGRSMKEPFHIYLKTSELVFMFDFLEHPSLLRDSLHAIGLFDAVAEPFHRVAER